MVGVMVIMAVSFKRTYARMPHGSQGCCIQCPLSRSQALLTHASAGDSWTLTGKSGSFSCGDTAPFSWVLVHTSFWCTLQEFCPQSCGSSVIKSHWPSKSNSLGVFSPFAGSPGWGCIVDPRTLKQGENFGIIVLRFVGHLLSDSMVGLMATSSKRIYATCSTSQVCCCQNPCPRRKPLLTHASPGDTQTLKDRPAQSFVGSLCPGVDKVLFEPSEYSGRYGDDSLNEP